MSTTEPSTTAPLPGDPTQPDGQPGRDVVPLRTATKAWFSISLQTFGGPAGQIAVMQRHLVDERRWIGQQRFLHALNYCMLLPGPEAQQLAIYVGWLLNGIRGGLIAGTLFVLPRRRGPARPVRRVCRLRRHHRGRRTLRRACTGRRRGRRAGGVAGRHPGTGQPGTDRLRG